MGGAALPPPSVPSVSGLQPIVRSNPQYLSKFRLAIAKTRAGLSDTHVLCVGDSTTFGQGDSNTVSGDTNLKSWPYNLSTMLNTYFAPSVPGMRVPPIPSGANTTIWAPGTGWASANNYGAGSSCAYGGQISAAGNLVATPGVLADSYYVYYLVFPGVKTFTATATGGTPVVISENSATQGIARTAVVAASASTENTVTFSAVTGTSGCYIVGVEPFLSTKSQILVGNAGASGTLASGWTASTAYGGVPFIKSAAPDLCLISLMINDANNSESVATWLTATQTLVAAAQLSGDVVLVSCPPSQSSTVSAREAQYLQAMYSYADSNGIQIWDIYTRWGSTWNTTYMTDALHPNDYGYWDWAQAMYSDVICI